MLKWIMNIINKNESDMRWCKGKSWVVRLPVLAFMIYLFYQNTFNHKYQKSSVIFRVCWYLTGIKIIFWQNICLKIDF